MTILVAVLYGMALIIAAFLPCYLIYFVANKFLDWFYQRKNKNRF